MSFTVRDTITEALARSNLVARRQAAPGQFVESAYRLLKGIASTYSQNNLLQFLRRECDLNEHVIQEDVYAITSPYYTEGVNFFYIINGDTSALTDTVELGAYAWDKGTHVWKRQNVGPSAVQWVAYNYPNVETALGMMRDQDNNPVVTDICKAGMQNTMIIGTIDLDIKNDFVQVPVEDVAEITEVYWDRTMDPNINTAIPLQFVSYEDFNNCQYGAYVYTWQHISDRKIEIKFKPQLMNVIKNNSGHLKIVYNVKYKFDLDSVLKIPDIYQELFISALTYKLACEYPRLSPEHTERLKNAMTEMENAVKTPTRANKLIVRRPAYGNRLDTLYQLESGSFIYPM